MSGKQLIADRLSWTIDHALRLMSPKLHRYVVETMFYRLPTFWEPADLKDDLNLEMDDLKIEMWTPSDTAPDVADRKMVERIFDAFRKAKEDQQKRDAVFMPSSLWQNLLHLSYPNYLDTNLDKFQYFLTNFGAWPEFLGMTFTCLLREYSKTPDRRKYFERQIIGRKVGWWLKFESRGRGLTNLSQPQCGNLWGAHVNGNFVTYESVLNEYYSRMISNFINKDRVVVGEIGAGYGVLFYFISRRISDFCYLDFDLPETLSCAAYYLMKSFPKKKFLLYGEANLNEKALKEYDFIFMPSYSIQDLANDSVDIFLNNSSLGEMKPDSCRMFVREMCRTAEAIWHMNHERLRNTYDDGTASLVNSEYPILEDRFDLVVRCIDALNAAWQGAFPRGYDYYSYYYRKRK